MERKWTIDGNADTIGWCGGGWDEEWKGSDETAAENSNGWDVPIAFKAPTKVIPATSAKTIPKIAAFNPKAASKALQPTTSSWDESGWDDPPVVQKAAPTVVAPKPAAIATPAAQTQDDSWDGNWDESDVKTKRVVPDKNLREAERLKRKALRDQRSNS